MMVDIERGVCGKKTLGRRSILANSSPASQRSVYATVYAQSTLQPTLSLRYSLRHTVL